MACKLWACHHKRLVACLIIIKIKIKRSVDDVLSTSLVKKKEKEKAWAHGLAFA
jgi:hypothetical protein